LKKKSIYVGLMLFVLTFTLLIPHQVEAYSYGNPNEDAIATAYTDMVAAMLKDPPDFLLVQGTLDSISDELVKEFGQEQVNLIQEAINDKDINRVTYEMQVVLVRNIERRLDNLTNSFEDYPQAKTLLAKAYATYEALSPNVVNKTSDLDQSIRTAFDQALETLGNPGLFGVGKVESDKQLFEEKKTYILTEIKNFFDTEAGYKGHTEGTGQTDVNVEGSTALSNWIPLIIIAVVLIGAVLFFTRKGNRKA